MMAAKVSCRPGIAVLHYRSCNVCTAIIHRPKEESKEDKKARKKLIKEVKKVRDSFYWQLLDCIAFVGEKSTEESYQSCLQDRRVADGENDGSTAKYKASRLMNEMDWGPVTSH